MRYFREALPRLMWPTGFRMVWQCRPRRCKRIRQRRVPRYPGPRDSRLQLRAPPPPMVQPQQLPPPPPHRRRAPRLRKARMGSRRLWVRAARRWLWELPPAGAIRRRAARRALPPPHRRSTPLPLHCRQRSRSSSPPRWRPVRSLPPRRAARAARRALPRRRGRMSNGSRLRQRPCSYTLPGARTPRVRCRTATR